MAVLKLGSKGADVKTLQQNLGLLVDGIFGPATDKLVRQFQTEHGLIVDGLVGPQTQLMIAKLKTENIARQRTPASFIEYNPLNVHVTKSANRSIKYLSIHFTAGSSSKPGRANSVKSVFEKRSASADFAVDDKYCVQFNPDIDNYYCWAVGDKKYANTKGAKYYGKAVNSNTISIEICSSNSTQNFNSPNHDGWYFTDEAIDNAVKLSKAIMTKYHIPVENVIRHYDISGKHCPGIIGWNDEPIYDSKTNKKTGKNSDSSKWIEFKKRLMS